MSHNNLQDGGNLDEHDKIVNDDGNFGRQSSNDDDNEEDIEYGEERDRLEELYSQLQDELIRLLAATRKLEPMIRRLEHLAATEQRANKRLRQRK